MNSMVYEYLNKTNNNPHKAYDEYIKYHLLSGKQLPEDIKGIKDFITASKPTITKIKKQTYKKQIITEYKMDLKQIVEMLEQNIKLYTECQKTAKTIEDARSYWTSLQAYKIMLCKITGKEYICENLPR
jgi:hypothetical protein